MGPAPSRRAGGIEDAQLEGRLASHEAAMEWHVWSGHSCPLPLPLIVRRRWSMCCASFPPSFEGRRRHDLPTSTVSRQLILVLRAGTLATHFTNNSQWA
jgi:hypothetical protein